ncbi:MAG: hypothetical protein H0V40_06520 [Actinobacteria bacterium]|nr:hypothetical protein [Actinomycetota bacterium]
MSLALSTNTAASTPAPLSSRPRAHRPGRLLAREAGFTLIELELLVVLIVMGILLGIAISSYVGARERGELAVAQPRVRVIIPSIEAYAADEGTYAGMTVAILRARYDRSLDDASYRFGRLTSSSYCVQSTAGGQTWRKPAPGEPIAAGACP